MYFHEMGTKCYHVIYALQTSGSINLFRGLFDKDLFCSFEKFYLSNFLKQAIYNLESLIL